MIMVMMARTVDSTDVRRQGGLDSMRTRVWIADYHYR